MKNYSFNQIILILSFHKLTTVSSVIIITIMKILIITMMTSMMMTMVIRGPSKLITVSVVGLSGGEKEKGSMGIGKSCLCNR